MSSRPSARIGVQRSLYRAGDGVPWLGERIELVGEGISATGHDVSEIYCQATENAVALDERAQAVARDYTVGV